SSFLHLRLESAGQSHLHRKSFRSAPPVFDGTGCFFPFRPTSSYSPGGFFSDCLCPILHTSCKPSSPVLAPSYVRNPASLAIRHPFLRQGSRLPFLLLPGLLPSALPRSPLLR